MFGEEPSGGKRCCSSTELYWYDFARVNYDGGGNQITCKKQLICSKSLANFITYWPTLLHNVVSSTPRHEWNSNSQRSGDSH